MAMAIRDSVTVSIAALISGTLSEISRVSRVVVSMSLGHEVGVARQQQDVVVGETKGGELLGQLHLAQSRGAAVASDAPALRHA